MGVNRAAKIYRLLRAIMNTAVDDGMIKRNPCRIKGADQERESARPLASVPQVYRLAETVPSRFRALDAEGTPKSEAGRRRVAVPALVLHRMGHSTIRAAMRYQHATDRRDRDIAAEMSRRATPTSE